MKYSTPNFFICPTVKTELLCIDFDSSSLNFGIVFCLLEWRLENKTNFLFANFFVISYRNRKQNFEQKTVHSKPHQMWSWGHSSLSNLMKVNEIESLQYGPRAQGHILSLSVLIFFFIVQAKSYLDFCQSD